MGFFSDNFVGSGWMRASERGFFVFREGRVEFLRPRESLKLASLDLLVGSLQDWRRRCGTCGRGLEVSGSVIVRKRGARKICIKRTGSMVGHNFKSEEFLPQKLWPHA